MGGAMPPANWSSANLAAIRGASWPELGERTTPDGSFWVPWGEVDSLWSRLIVGDGGGTFVLGAATAAGRFFNVHWFCLANRSAAVLMSGDSGPLAAESRSSRSTGLLRLAGAAAASAGGKSHTKSGAYFCRSRRPRFTVVSCPWEAARRCHNSRFAEKDDSSSDGWASVALWDFHWCRLPAPRCWAAPPSCWIPTISSDADCCSFVDSSETPLQLIGCCSSRSRLDGLAALGANVTSYD